MCSAADAIFVLEALYLAVATPLRRKSSVNRRLKIAAEGQTGEAALQLLRSERGILDSEFEVMSRLRQLLVQSGLRAGPRGLVLAMAGTFAASLALLVLLAPLEPWQDVVLALAPAIALPIVALQYRSGGGWTVRGAVP